MLPTSLLALTGLVVFAAAMVVLGVLIVPRLGTSFAIY